MITRLQAMYSSSERSSRIIYNMIVFFIEEDTYITDIDFFAFDDVALGHGDVKFQVNKNGTPLFATSPSDLRPVMTVGTAEVLTSGLSIAVSKGDIISVDKISTGIHTSPIACQLKMDDGIPFYALSDVPHTSASMADLAEVSEDIVSIGKSFILNKITADKACRVRLYRAASFRTADASRPSGTLPSGEHGVIVDITFTGAGTYTLAPIPFGINAESVRVSDTPALIQNLSGATDTVTLGFNVIKLED